MKNNTKKLAKVRKYMREHELDGIIVESWQNVYYLSGFTGYGDAVLLITAKAKYIFTDSRYYVQAEQQSGDFTLVKCYSRSLEEMKKVLKSENVEKIGFEDAAVGYAQYVNYYKKLRVKLEGLGQFFLEMRTIKTEEEIEDVVSICALASAALERTLPFIKAGMTEIEVAAKLEYEMRAAGADKPSFDTIVASGVRGSMPHGTASSKIIEKGDGVTIDFGAFGGGMCSDMTRTVFVGEPSAKMREIYEVVKEAQQTAIDGYKSGMTGGDLDALARRVIQEHGYGEYFGHSLGHGVGIDVHEGVSVSRNSKLVLKPGMIFSVEPGIYIPGLGGVRIEDLVTIRKGKLDMVTKSPSKELTIL
jgi:Xaa-Pro aminopeptidase